MQRKSTYLFLSLLLTGLFSFANPPKEGMWIPLLLKQQNEAEMQAMGMKLSAEDIYSVNKSSLKDAIISFGGFCTGSVISPKGLILTNHHCGYGQIQQHSTVENNILTDGFWAKDRKAELPNPGLSVTFIVRIEDVTDQVLKDVNEDMDDGQRQSIVDEISKKLEAEAVKGTHYEAEIKPFFYGNEYYMIVTETFNDIRLVGAPPSSIGKFGGDTDNWMWPRHTGDFSLFRIYADKDNKPADYSPSNVPYTPKHYLPINVGGLEKDDFTMVFGFPGRTQEYLPSDAVEHLFNEQNPIRIRIREDRLEIMKKYMRRSNRVKLQYSAKYARVSNYHKKWIGENRGLKKLDAINKKEDLEKDFTRWVNADGNRKSAYGNILPRYEEIYNELGDLALFRDFINESAFGIEFALFAYRFDRAFIEPISEEDFDESKLDKFKEKGIQTYEGHFRDYHAPLDKEVTVAMLKIMETGLPAQMRPQIYLDIQKKYKGDYERYADYVFEKSLLTDEKRLKEFMNEFEMKDLKKLQKDPAYLLMRGFLEYYREKVAPPYFAYQNELNSLGRKYVKALREMNPDKVFYPDANSTIRITYGQVKDYYPADGVYYDFYTTLDGVMQKYLPGDEEFDLPEKLIQLYEKKDYGPYAHSDGSLRVCFTGSNHTTGGNSGSPVIDGEGRLVGLNFDRNWEGTMSDIMYDPDRCRNIAVDVRYVLFLVDKFAGANHLIEELQLENLKLE